MSRGNKRIAIIITSILIVIFMLGILVYIFAGKKTAGQITILEDEQGLYDATVEIQKAKDKLKEDKSSATVIQGVETAEKVVALTFDGMVDQDTTKQLLGLLSQYEAKTIFFLPGIKSAEDPETIKAIEQSGQIIGNYTLRGKKDITKLSKEKLVEDFSQTNVILKNITGRKPSLLKANSPKYTKKILQSSYASGLESVIHSSYFLSYQSLSSQEMALSYVKGLEKGSIISVKTDDVLDQSEYTKPVKNKEEKPAIDPKPTIDSRPEESVDPNKRLIEMVGFLLAALKEEEYKIVLASELGSYEGMILPAGDTPLEGVESGLLTPDKGKNKVVSVFSPVIRKPSVPKPKEDEKEPPVQELKVDKEPANYQEKRIQNNGDQAKVRAYFHTTEPTVAYTFRGIADQVVLKDILDILDKLDATASFFVTGKEIVEYPENVGLIIERGHQIANGGYGMITTSPRLLDFDSLAYEIDMGERYLKAFLKDDYSKSSHQVYMPLYGDTSGDVLEVASALGYTEVVTYNRSAIQGSYQDLQASEIMDQYFSNVIALYRGDIVHFRLDYLTRKGVVQELVEEIAVNYIKPATYNISDLASLGASPLLYTPKTKEEVAKTSVIRKTYGYLEEYLGALLTQKYIGNPDINSEKELMGFSPEEIAKIDTVGKIKANDEKVIFLTFDDWGSDISISHLLNVLKKHDAKATFFIRVGSDNLSYDADFINPNLLRAIALDGHDVGNHTFKHVKINIEGEAEKEFLQKDVLKAHEELSRYIGDTSALKQYFRPPTLAVSKAGLYTILDMGYEYIINGDFSSHDYEASSANQLINRLKNGLNIADSSQMVDVGTPLEDRRIIENGSIVVMHMSDESRYTPEALDTIIPYYQNLGYRFAKLSDYLN
ncbi:MAG TPA: polysaccharide deacetylase family protein [Epulopiscium sp.]|nr:polysaccharide deacetylase family protein [Candidatus Epulonipiscium sp.]